MLFNYLIYSTIFLLFAFAIFRIIVRNDYLKRSKLSPVSYMPELFIFVIHENLIYLFIPVNWPDFPSLPESQILIILSLFVFCIGSIILLIAWFGLGSGTSFGQDKKGLNKAGLYYYSRNPQLFGYGMMLQSFHYSILPGIQLAGFCSI